MYYFYKKPAKEIVVEDTNRFGVNMLPSYYAGQWITMYAISKVEENDSTLFNKIRVDHHYFKELYDKDFFKYHPECKPQYALFIGNTRLNKRVNNFKQVFPNLTLEYQAEPGFIDKVLYKLNPVNKNETIFIYKIN